MGNLKNKRLFKIPSSFLTRLKELNMKLITISSIGLTGYLLINSYAMAATVIGGTVCHAYDGLNTKDTLFYSHGIVNAAAKARVAVVCPITKRSNDYAGITTKIHIDSQGAETVACTLYSRASDGSLLGSKAARNSGSGKEILTLRVSSSTPTGYFAAVCTLPPNEAAEIYSLEVLN
jgi:hypothetical protein